MNISAIIFVIIGICLVLWRRTSAMRKPIRGNGFRILLPIIIFIIFIPLITVQIVLNKDGTLGNTSLLPSLLEVVVAFGLGLIFSVPMVMTTNYEIREDNQIYAKKNTAFIYALIGLIIIRIALRSYFSMIDPITLSLLSLILALGYIGVWRIVSFIKFRKVLHQKNGIDLQ